MIDKRMMYAQGQRVAKSLDGSRPGYRGDAAYRSDSEQSKKSAGGQGNVGSQASFQDNSNAGQGFDSSGKSEGASGSDNRASDTQEYNQYETIFRNTGVDNNPLRPSGIKPGFINPGDIDNLTLRPYEQQRVDFLDQPYEKVNIPLGVPGGMFMNTVGNFVGELGYNKNKNYFMDNVAGKYGYGYGKDDYDKYMKERMAGSVNAYGRPLTESEITLRDGEGGGGIMDVVTERTIDDTNDNFFSRFLQNQPEDVRKEIEARIQNYYTV
tara:strand:- start:37 stop:837 length:801 start_codon:yes stop_codon:yes gene_type:complete